MELIGKQIAIETILGQPPELHYPSWYAAQIEKLPPAPPEYLAEQVGILVTDSDTISRQASISAICNACGKIDCDKMDKCEKLQLPPASSSEIPNSSDTISRAKAIDALDKRFDSIPMEQTSEILMLRKDLRELPPAQPKRGRWIGKYPVTSVCSECGFLIHDSKVKAFAYCPNCGAEMRGEQDE